MFRRSGCLAALRPSHVFSHIQGARYASLNSAIQRGLKETRYHDPSDRPSRNRVARSSNSERPSRNRPSRGDDANFSRESRGTFGRGFDRESRTGNFERGPRNSRYDDPLNSSSPYKYQRQRFEESRRSRDPAAQSHKVLKDLKETVYQEHMDRGIGPSSSGDQPFRRTKRPSLHNFTTPEQKVFWKPFEDERPSRKRRDEQMPPHGLLRKTYLVPPKKIPYTTAYSEFIYGTSAVQAALRCGRRKFHTLYIYVGEEAEDIGNNNQSTDRQENAASIRKLGLAMGVKVKNVLGPWLEILDKMSGGRPHNGFVLECNPLPKLPVESYEPVSHSATHFDVQVGSQSEEEATVNGSDGHIHRQTFEVDYTSNRPRTRHPYPLTLLLDGIRDTGNMGAIIRSAYYFGADAVAISARNSAPISAVTIKASAGAAENIPIFTVRDPVELMRKSQANGWRFFAAEAPDSTNTADSNNKQKGASSARKPMLRLSDLRPKLSEAPCVLMLGSEDQGLSKRVRARADAYVGIPGAFTGRQKEDTAGVDSLNVSVASALLCEAFLGGQGQTEAPSSNGSEKFF